MGSRWIKIKSNICPPFELTFMREKRVDRTQK